MSRTPIVVIPGRFSASASALRYRAVVTARALSEAVLRAGGEPVTVHPWAPDGAVTVDEVADRLRFADAVLLPGGGDLSPERYGQQVEHDAVYDVDHEQDAFDLAVAEWALGAGVPLLAVCRGTQVVNVLRGGTLRQHMDDPHRHVVHEVAVDEGSRLSAAVGPAVTASCYHHQALERLGDGLHVVARAEDGTPEAIELDGHQGWFLGVQWHPEDTAETDPVQLAVFRGLVDAARA
ncbi:MAG: gamma-glutamyl-gamma-aminobutyrate hydrolase family protein [Candidatus Nanopelagicales bacterium]